jgi:hypothetical protein
VGHTQPAIGLPKSSVTIPESPVTLPKSPVTIPEIPVTMDRNTHRGRTNQWEEQWHPVEAFLPAPPEWNRSLLFGGSVSRRANSQ